MKTLQLSLQGINFIESHMEAILKQAALAKSEDEKIYFWGKYIRFWEMMKLLRDTAYVNRRDMVNCKHLFHLPLISLAVFQENIIELDSYVVSDIVCYLTRGTRFGIVLLP